MTKNKRIVTVQAKYKYGKERIYPIGETARLFCSLLKQDTLTRENLKLIKALGFELEEIPTSIDLEKL